MERFLDGVRVVEIGHGVALAYTGLLLADAGAEVIKVEPQEGDPLRREGPIAGEVGAVFAALNRGKKSVTSRDDVLLERLLAERNCNRNLVEAPYRQVRGQANPSHADALRQLHDLNAVDRRACGVACSGRRGQGERRIP